MEVSPDWSKNIRDVDGIEFIALSRKEQNRLRLVRKKETVGRKVSKSAVLKYDKREERRAREVEKERMVNILMGRTGYGEKDIRHQYESFMKMCPEGSLTKKIFIDFSRKLYGHHAKQLSVAIFDIFDQDLSGKIDFLEYMLVVREIIMVGHLLLTLIFEGCRLHLYDDQSGDEAGLDIPCV